jgi:sugar/nucleoside kinase (ribokinase family)
LFFDFADITMRGAEDMKETFRLLSGYNPPIQKTISLNEHEAALLFSCYGEKLSGDMEAAALSAEKVRAKIGFDELIIHTPHFAAAASKTETAAVKQRYCENPVRTAGAGDSFNGGYISACCTSLSLAQRLTVANATTYFFVANGYPPSRNRLGEVFQ